VARNGFQRPADHALGAVGRGGVDDIDAEIDGLQDQPRGLVLRFAGIQAELAEPPAPQPRDADAKAGAAKSGVVHDGLSMIRGEENWPRGHPSTATPRAKSAWRVWNRALAAPQAENVDPPAFFMA